MAFDGRLLGGISVLAAVVETGNFVRAAEALGLTQSGISRAVARLELFGINWPSCGCVLLDPIQTLSYAPKQ